MMKDKKKRFILFFSLWIITSISISFSFFVNKWYHSQLLKILENLKNLYHNFFYYEKW
jgi:hypothetical protein